VKPLLSVQDVIEHFSRAVFSITFMGEKTTFLACSDYTAQKKNGYWAESVPVSANTLMLTLR
jgi:hypothetical protein